MVIHFSNINEMMQNVFIISLYIYNTYRWPGGCTYTISIVLVPYFINLFFVRTDIIVGHSVNYAVVMAQLYTKGKSEGPHLFLVQLRDEETHEPLPGIILN